MHSLKNLLSSRWCSSSAPCCSACCGRSCWNAGSAGEGFFRTVYLFPMAVSFVASGVVWRWLMNSGTGDNAGGLNADLRRPRAWASWRTRGGPNPNWGMAAMAMPAIWQLSGYVMALFLAGFRGIPQELREAAAMDGASTYQLYRHVHLPAAHAGRAVRADHRRPHVDEDVRPDHGVSGAQWLTEVPAVYVWQALLTSDYAKAAAISIILLLLVAIVIVPYLIYTTGRRSGHDRPHAATPAELPEARRPPSGADRAPSGRTADAVAGTVVKYALVLFFLLIVLMPAVRAGRDQLQVRPRDRRDRPVEPAASSGPLASWEKAWTALRPSFLRTFQLAIPVAVISSIIGAANGFVLSRWRFPGADVVFTLILFGMFIPYQAVMIPLREIVTTIGIPPGIPTLVFVHCVYGIPICTLIFRNYYATTVPEELIEAAPGGRRRAAAHVRLGSSCRSRSPASW